MEQHLTKVEPFAEWLEITRTRRPRSRGRGRIGRPTSKHESEGVAENQPIGAAGRRHRLGVSLDGELTLVVQRVVPAAKPEKVAGIGGAAVDPVNEVMYVEMGCVTAAGEAASAVTVEDDIAEPVGHDPMATAEMQRATIALEQDLGVGVASEVAEIIDGEQRAEMQATDKLA